MTKIKVKERSTTTNLNIRFMKDGEVRRAWLYDFTQWYRTVGFFCPHINLGNDQCVDCGLDIT